MGNIWETVMETPTLVNDREIYMKAHITNKPDDMIELAKGTMEIQNKLELRTADISNAYFQGKYWIECCCYGLHAQEFPILNIRTEKQ